MNLKRTQTVLSFLVVLLAFGLTSEARADDVSNAGQMLCASLVATRCNLDGCVTGDPVEWNIPQFIEIDLEKKILRTTAASGQNRSTPITTLVRDGEHIYIQGIEGGRAFSFVIHGPSGDLNAAVAASTTATAVFASCTPLPDAK